jgi:polyisoprenoid-binding protein YceI
MTVRSSSVRTLALSTLLIAGVAGGMAMLNADTQPVAVAQGKSEPAPVAATGEFKVDPVHSSVVFKIKHMGTANFYGRFNDVSGTFGMGPDGLKADVTVKADSVDTNNTKRDEHVKSNDFFSAKEFPTITFKADKLAKSADGNYSGTGKLTFRGVTKDVNVTIEHTGSGKGREGKAMAGIEARLTIKRSDFGNDKMVGPLSDEVMLVVALEGAGA